ncbi:hypothetical protein BDK92_7178 [Micromonospora pisi]|uniref:Uncharacterized protein n=1 Tax=Micromonospora pisi TaxID=589240 RepID=A0A495JUN1_9ACTN|nr:hypothetical protein [Micromonospora pisi]RKR92700.1 hypothetical protein BDK92_7178 [Micromonospora pisi]
MAKTTAEASYTGDQVEEALSRAVDDLLDRVQPLGEEIGDALRVLMNVGMHYLEHPDAADLEEAIGAKYAEDPETVMGWVAACD